MTSIRLGPVLAALCVAAAWAWSASAGAQSASLPAVPAVTNGAGTSIEQRLYPSIPTGGIMTESQDRSAVTLGSGGSIGVPASPGSLGQPAFKPPPGTIAGPLPGVARALSGDAAGSFPGSTGADPSSAVQGLYTAPSERDPLGRFTP